MKYTVIIPWSKIILDNLDEIKVPRGESPRSMWCRANVGEVNVAWYSYARVPDGMIYKFRKEEDATMFALRWC